MSKVKKMRFEYKKRDKVAVQKRATQSGGLFDSIFKNEFTVWKPKDGNNRVRFLPPTWEDPEHFGLDVYVHFGIGSDSQSYLCLNKMKGKLCPICEEKHRADKTGDADYSRELSSTKRVLVWIIDRDDEETGPQLWSMPWTVDRDIAALSIDKRTREILFLDSPEEGFDIEFTKTGSKLKTKYIGMKVDRRPSPLSDDDEVLQEWMQFIEDNPLPTVLQYFDAEHIALVAAGKKASKDEDEDEEEAPRTRKRSAREDEDEDEEEAPRTRKRSARDEDEDEWNPMHRPSKKRSPPFDEDEDEEEAPPKKKAKAKPAAEDEDEDEEYECVACSDTGRSSKGGFCVCAKGRRLKARYQAEDEEEEDDPPRRRSRK